MKIFETEKNSNLQVLNIEHLLLIPEFEHLHINTNDYNLFVDYMKFIELYCSPKLTNPYSKIEKINDIRKNKIINDIKINIDNNIYNEFIIPCIKYYENILEQNINYKFFKSAFIAVENLKNFLDNLDLNDTGKNGMPKYQPNVILSTLEGVDKIIQKLNKLHNNLHEDLNENIKTKKESTLSLNETKNI